MTALPQKGNESGNLAAAVDVCAAVIRRGNRFLLATRPARSHLEGKWEFPGGKVQAGETPSQCIRRELAEELGIELDRAVHLGTVIHRYRAKTVRLLFMACSMRQDLPVASREGQKIGWFSPEQLEALDLAPADRRFLPTLRALCVRASCPESPNAG